MGFIIMLGPMRTLPPLPALSQSGFSYIALLITLALIALATAATLQMGVLLQQRVAEEELLAIGTEFHYALISYANASQPGQIRVPKRLEDLLKDPRAPNIRRHLRKIYTDPLTGSDEWGITPSFDGRGIVGIFSMSNQKPIKISNFPPLFQNFGEAATYRDWQFMGAAADRGTPANRPPDTNQSQNRIDPTRPENRPFNSGQNQVPGGLETK